MSFNFNEIIIDPFQEI